MSFTLRMVFMTGVILVMYACIHGMAHLTGFSFEKSAVIFLIGVVASLLVNKKEAE